MELGLCVSGDYLPTVRLFGSGMTESNRINVSIACETMVSVDATGASEEKPKVDTERMEDASVPSSSGRDDQPPTVMLVIGATIGFNARLSLISSKTEQHIFEGCMCQYSLWLCGI